MTIPAPAISPTTLWAMPPDKFNEWRRENDYPRILAFFKQRFAEFKDWQTSQQLSDAELFEFGLGRFIGPETQLFIYRLKKGVFPGGGGVIL